MSRTTGSRLVEVVGGLARAAAVAAAMAAGAFAQTDTAHVPFVVNANATVTAEAAWDTVSITVTKDVEAVLKLPLPKKNSVLNADGAHGLLNAPTVTKSRGNITLRLPHQSYQNAEIALYTINGKRIMRTNASASEAVNGVLRRNVAAGVYILSAIEGGEGGKKGSAFTTRLTHNGGNLNVNVAFGAPDRRLAKAAEEDASWEITVSAAEYEDSSFTLTGLVKGTNNPTQTIDLKRILALTGITAAYNQGTAAVYPTTPLDELKDGLTVTANYNDNTNKTLAPQDYTLSGTLAVGQSTVTVTYEGKTATFTVTVTAPHVHEYVWQIITPATATADGTETQVCSHDNSHTGSTRPLYATGTAGLAFEIIDDGGDNDGTYRLITGVDAAAVHIPAYHRPAGSTDYGDYLPVTEIGEWVFWENESLTSISIPASVTAIGNNAFGGSYSIPMNLETVTFGANSQLATIGNSAFAYTSFTNITIPAGVTAIGNNAFEECTSLTTVTFAANSQLATIGNSAFQWCEKLTNITIPSSVTKIGNSAFSRCSSFTSIIIPASVTEIGIGAFTRCTNITEITIPATVTTVGVGAFTRWTSAQTINVPFANAGAKPSGWDADWTGSVSDPTNTNPTIKYWNGSSYQ